MPKYVERALARYSDWAAVPVRSVVYRRDLVSIAIILALGAGNAWYVDSWMGFVLAAAAGVFAWIWIEASQA